MRRDVTESARGKKVGVERRDVTDSARRNRVVGEKRDVTDIATGPWEET